MSWSNIKLSKKFFLFLINILNYKFDDLSER